MRTPIAILVEINKTLDVVYGTTHAYIANSTVVLWAIEQLTDVDEAKVVIRKINDKRFNLGLVGINIPYGHRFF